MDYNMKIEEKDFSYEELKKIKQHAQKYDSSAEKKEFLKNAGAYEQKLILLESKNPYEVLNYLNEIDSKSSNLVLSELNLEEITKILELFSAEDKKQFYKTFSHLELVNQFIAHDKNSSEYIEDLTFNRKVELLDSSDPSTVLATSKVYESMPYVERQITSNLITNSDAMVALSTTDRYIDDAVISEAVQNNNLEANEITEEKITEIIEQKEKDVIIEEDKPQMSPELELAVNEFIKNRIAHYIEIDPRFKDIDINDANLYHLLPEELRMIVDNDFHEAKKEKEENKEEKQPKIKEEQQVVKEESYNQTETTKDISAPTENSNIEKESDVINLFQQAKQSCELNEITKIKNSINALPPNDIQDYYQEEVPKTK